jgi:hypothetical protein
MRRTLATALVAVAAGAAVAGKGDAAEVDLVQNGGFESGVAGWRALNLSGQCSFESDAKEKKSGKHSLRIDKSGPGKPDWLKQSADLPGGVKDVRAAVWFKVEKGARADVTVYFFDAAGETIGKGDIALVSAGATKKWERAEERFEVPKGATGVGVNVKVTTKGTFWLDGLELKVAGAGGAAAGLANGGFESDLDGWRAVEPASGTAEARADASVRASGKASARIARASARLFPEDGLVTDVLLPGDAAKLRVAFQARVDGVARAAVILQALDERGVCVASVRAPAGIGAGRFGPGEATLDAPKGSRKLVVYLLASGAGTVWFDDVALGEVK